MADARVIVESVLREKGLLKSCIDFRTDYAVQQILTQVEPPTKPRPDPSILGTNQQNDPRNPNNPATKPSNDQSSPND